MKFQQFYVTFSFFGHGEQSFFYEIEYTRVYSHDTCDSSGCPFFQFDFFKKGMQAPFISHFLIIVLFSKIFIPFCNQTL